MKPEPLIFDFPIDGFDLEKLPMDSDLLRSNPEMLRDAVSSYFAEQFKTLGGEAQISIRDGTVSVRWVPESGLAGLVKFGTELLQRGDSDTGIILLQAALARMPDNPVILYNLGIAYSDKKRLPEAIALLSKCVEIQSGDARSWIALGVALSRNKQDKDAEKALRRGIELDPEDGYGFKNLGGLVARRNPEEGLKLLARASLLLPDDPVAQCSYGMALLENGQATEADKVLKRVVEMAPLTEAAEDARTALTRIAQGAMQKPSGGMPRMDAVMYCLAAMRLFRESPELVRTLTYEITLLGRNGLDINDPTPKYSLKTLPGAFSGLHLVSYLYVGMKELSPAMDAGIDLSKEYEQARQIFKKT